MSPIGTTSNAAGQSAMTGGGREVPARRSRAIFPKNPVGRKSRKQATAAFMSRPTSNSAESPVLHCVLDGEAARDKQPLRISAVPPPALSAAYPGDVRPRLRAARSLWRTSPGYAADSAGGGTALIRSGCLSRAASPSSTQCRTGLSAEFDVGLDMKAAVACLRDFR